MVSIFDSTQTLQKRKLFINKKSFTTKTKNLSQTKSQSLFFRTKTRNKT